MQKKVLPKLIVFGSLFLSIFLYNNCSGQMATEETTDAASVGSQSFSGNFTGNVDFVSADGKIWGYAYDNANKSLKLNILFYLNGPVGTGTYIGSTTANVQYTGSNAGHFFSMMLPAQYINGKASQLYTYVHSAKPENLVYPSPLSFASYAPKAESFYNSSVAPLVATQCNGCHQWTYRQLFFGPLMNPLPVNGGTSTNNRLFQKISGGTGHSGGNKCPSGPDTGICAQVKAWWLAEFQ